MLKSTGYRERCKAPVYSKSGALRWGQDRERHLLQHGLPKRRKEVPTLEEFAPRVIEAARADRRKPSAVEAMESIIRVHLLPLLGSKRLDAVTAGSVQELKAALNGRAPKTLNNVLTMLNTLFKKAVEWDVIDRIPCNIRLVAAPKPTMTFHDFAEFERLVVAARDRGWRAELSVLLGGEAGLRLGEITALEWRDVDLSKRQICVRRSESHGHVTVPKGGRERYVPLTSRLISCLREHRHLRLARVLCGDDGTPLTPKIISDHVRRAAKDAQLEDRGVHILRHTFCSHLAMRGAPARAIQELAGHQDLNTTQRYMHLSPAALDAAIRLLESPGVPSRRGDMLETAAVGIEKATS